mmetsp:Transcript_18524/g.27200  ORF Transcript_18524/g.27200 Transcript_18524/m.27200 type:complete len:382 (+) Transcript_18524:36-1181(+)
MAVEPACSKSMQDDRCARVFTRRKAGELKRSKSKPLVLTKEMLATLFDRPLKQAASSLGVSATALKGICRKLEIHRWPFQQARWMAVRSGSEDMNYAASPEALSTLGVNVSDNTYRCSSASESEASVASGPSGHSKLEKPPTFEAMLGQATFHDDLELEEFFNNQDLTPGKDCNSPLSCLNLAATAQNSTFRPASSYHYADAEAHSSNPTPIIPKQHGLAINAPMSNHTNMMGVCNIRGQPSRTSSLPVMTHIEQQQHDQRELDMHMHSQAWNAWAWNAVGPPSSHSMHTISQGASKPAAYNNSYHTTHSLRHALANTPPPEPSGYDESSAYEGQMHQYDGVGLLGFEGLRAAPGNQTRMEELLLELGHSGCDLSYLWAWT